MMSKQAMNLRIVQVFVIFWYSLSGVQAEKIQTCQDVKTSILSRDLKIKKMESKLFEYELADQNKIEDVEDACNAMDTCSSCQRVESALNCGWCFLRNRCTLQEKCGTGTDADSWIGPGGHGCPRIRKITPQQLPSVRPDYLDIHITHLPPYDGVFICSFLVLGQTFINTAQRTGDGMRCWPEFPLEFPIEIKYATVAVTVRTANGPDFVPPANFTIYVCHRYKSCSECVSNPFPCSWCLASSHCTHDVNENCRSDIIVDSAAISKPRIRKGQEYCAKIVPNHPGGPTEILVPAGSGSKKRIFVKAENIVQFIVTTKLFCTVAGHTPVEAQILGDIIYCSEIEFKPMDRSPISNLSLGVLWGDDRMLDNPYDMHVLVFDCSLLATSCGTCLELPERYNCGWCEGTNSCMVQDQCKTSLWLDRKQRCTKPEIKSFHPKASLINKTTNITIDGVNLGKQPNDIHVRLVNEGGDTIAECIPYEDLYVTSTRIVCLLDIPETSAEGNETLSGFFEILLWNQFIAVSNEDFSFVDPSITAINPSKGVISGGTFLEIQGRHLDAGSKVDVLIADNPCKIVSRDASVIRCITSPSRIKLERPVQVVFDGESRTSSVSYSYVEDPWVRYVKSEHRGKPKGTPSGGSLITVVGEHMDHVTNPPYMYITIEDEEYIGACTVESPTEMKCLSPRIPVEKLNFCGEDGFLELDYSFKIDNVGGLENISQLNGFGKLQIFPEPYLLPFNEEGKIKIYKTDYLVINGRNIDRVYNDDDITLTIGNGTCALTSLSHSQLTCRPPDTQPPARDGNLQKLPEVVVKVSESMEFFIGYLRYVS